MGKKAAKERKIRPDQAPRKELIQRCLPLLRPYWKKICLATLAMVLEALMSVLRPWPLKVVIDRVLSNKPSRVPFLHAWLDSAPYSRMEILFGACAASILIAVIAGLFAYYYTLTMGNVGHDFVSELRRSLFSHMQRLSLRFHDQQRTGDLTHRLTSDIREVQDMIASGIGELATNILLLIGIFALMLWLNWRFAIISLSISPFLFLTVVRYKRHIKTATRRARRSAGLLASLAQETLASIRIVQGLAQEDQLDERFHAQSETQHREYLEIVRYQARVSPLVDVFATVGLTVVMWYGATRVLKGELTTGDVVLFFTYVATLYNPMKGLARFSFVLDKAGVAAERIGEVLLVRSDVADRQGARSLSQLKGAIEFRDVSFEYEPGRPVLLHLNLAVAPGEKVAFVGATGAGKSTLASLIPRFYDPTLGEVRIDGEDIRNYTVQSLREQISLVLQDSLLFSGSLRENIAFGRPGASDEEIAAAAVMANADEFIQRLPQGYDALVGERGVTLSGGQKQRIAIARAILRDAPILILDEPTSNLDAVSEQLVMDALDRAAAGRTTFIIAHRLSTTRLADRIVVLDRGAIVEVGTHAELMARNGKYAAFYNQQMLTEEEKTDLAMHDAAVVAETDWKAEA